MDYYYSLLESYELLKRRKFKLSIREEEDRGEPASSPDDIISAMAGKEEGDEMSFAHPNGKHKATATIKNNRKGTPYIRVKFGQAGPALPIASTTGTETRAEAGQFKPNIKKLEDWFAQGGDVGWSGKQTGEGETTIGQQVEPEAKVQITTDQALDNIVNSVGDTLDTILNPDTEEGSVPVDYFPGFDTNRFGERIGTRRPETLVNVIEGKAQGWGGNRDSVQQQLFNTPDDMVSAQKRIEAAETLNRTLGFIQSRRDNGWTTEEGVVDPQTGVGPKDVLELRELADKVKIHKMGVSFDGIFFFYREGSTAKNDVLRNAVDQINDTIDAYNSQWENSSDEVKKKNRIKNIETAKIEGTGGVKESWRGPVAEKIMRVSALTAKTRLLFLKAEGEKEKRAILKKHREKIADVYEEALEDGSLEELQQVFARGQSVLLNEVVGDLQSMDDAQYVAACTKVMLDRGMEPEQIADLLEMIKDDRTIGMALIVGSFANQNFDQDLFGEEVDLIPDDIEHSGTEAMTSYGEKEDARFKWESEDGECKNVKEHYTKLLGDLTKKYKGACGTTGEDAWAGTDKMMQTTDDGQCMLGVEPKTLTSSKSTFGSGMVSMQRTAALCRGETLQRVGGKGEDTETMSFWKTHTERLDKCLGEGTSQNACKKLNEIQGEADKMIAAMQPGKGVVGVKNAGQSSLELWWSNKTQTDPVMIERFAAAKRALNTKTPDPDDLKQLKKVHQDIFQAVLMRDMPQGKMDPENPDHKEWIDYLTQQYHLGVGTDEEMLRIGRGLDDGFQGVYLNNAEVARNMSDINTGKARWAYDGGGTIHLVQDHEVRDFTKDEKKSHKLIDTEGLTGDELDTAEKKNAKAKERLEIDTRKAKREGKAAHSPVKVDTARGEWKYSVPKYTYNEVETPSKEEGSKEEDILVSFLRGQQKLLEKILTQTS